MRFEDATSKEQVEQALADDDEEMRESLDAFLEEARDSFMRSSARYGIAEDDPFGFTTGREPELEVIVHNEKFRDLLIKESSRDGAYDQGERPPARPNRERTNGPHRRNPRPGFRP